MSTPASPVSARITLVARPLDDESPTEEIVHVGCALGDGALDLKCSECGELVVRGGGLDFLLEFLFECPRCRSRLRLDMDMVQRGLARLH